MACLDEATILGFFRGTLDAASIETVEAEMDRCATCRGLVAQLAKGAHAEIADLTEGTVVGRYQVERRLGAGAMGTVYAAHDPVVGRTVALKLIPAHTFRDPSTVLREARAMGRVAHGGVVSVFDAGVTEAHVFVAMELVAGGTLAAWMKTAAPEASLRAFARIADALAAAHDAGIVHGDFKPDNVMVSEDGAPKVTDFGLARIGERVEAGAPEGTFALASTRLTRGGGTPAYMAPEQLAGGAADPLSDQFAFFVSLYEALAGRRPYPGTSLALAEDATPVDLSPVPRHARAVIARGLASRPTERFPSMRAAAAALSHAIAPRRRWPFAVAGVGLAGAVIGGVLMTRGERAPAPCAEADAPAGAAWTIAQRAVLMRAPASSQRPYAAQAVSRLVGDLDDYAGKLRGSWIRACRATHVEHTQSSALLDRRSQCLTERTRALSTLTAALAAAEPKVVVANGGAAGKLPDLAPCDDLTTLAELAPPPSDPAVRAAVAKVDDEVASANAAIMTGRYEQSLPIAQAAAKAAEATKDRRTHANALYVLGKLQWAIGDLEATKTTLEAALIQSTGARDRVAEANLHLQLARLIGIELGKPDDAAAHAALGLALTEAMTDAASIRAGILEYQGAVLQRENQWALALAKYDEALQLYAGREQNQDETSHLLGLKGICLCELGRRDEGIAAFEKDLELTAARLGTSHPAYANELSNLGSCYSRVDTARALEIDQQAHEIRVKALDANHPYVGISAGNLGNKLVDANRYDEGIRYLEQSLAIKTKALPAGHPSIGIALSGLARAHGAAKHPQKQLELATAARDLFAALGPDHPELAGAHAQVGNALIRLKRPAEAIAALELAIAGFRKGQGQTDAFDVATSSFNLANVLWDTKRDRTRAIALINEARAIFQRIGDDVGVRDATEWLRKRGALR